MGEIVREITSGKDVCTELAQGLHDVLARTQLLLMKTQVFHWNAAGANLAEFHAATRMQFRDLMVAVDVIGERMRALSLPSVMSFSDLLTRAEWLDKYPPSSIESMIRELVCDHREIARRLRSIAESATADGDMESAELLSARLVNHHDAVRILKAISSP